MSPLPTQQPTTDSDLDDLRAKAQRLANPSSRQPADSPRFSIIAGIAMLLLAGMVFGASLWVLASLVAGLMVAINFFLAKTWTNAAVAVRNTGDKELKIGDWFEVEITLTNTSRVPILWLLVEDLLPRWATGQDSPALEIEGDRLSVLLLWGGESRQLHYKVHCHRRGYFQVGPTVLETGDMMGLYRRYRVGTPPQFVTVLPKVLQLTSYEIGSRRPIGEIRMRDNVMDDPTRLRGIRRWQPGDPMRSVHWAATARTGTLHSKVYEPSSIAGATLVLDLHTSTTPARHEPTRSDLAISAAASIAQALHESNEPVGLATNGRDAADRIRREGWTGDHRVRGNAIEASAMLAASDRLRPVWLPALRGPVHLQEMIRTLARLERTDGLTLSELLVESEAQLSAETTLLVITQRCTPDSTAAMIGFARRGRAVAVIINTHDINDYSESAGPLIAARIPTFHLASAEVIPQVCRQTLLR